MRTFTLFVLCSGLLLSCSKDDDIEPMIWFSGSDIVTTNYTNDSLYKFSISHDRLCKYEVSAGISELIIDCPYYVFSKNVNTGYGQTVKADFKILQIDVHSSSIAVSAKSADSPNVLVTVYDYSLDSITSVYSEKSSYQRWGWDQFFIVSESGQCNRYSERGSFLETIESDGGFFFPSVKDIILDKNNFIKLYDAQILKYSLTGKGYWRINLYDNVKNKPASETNPPQITFKNYSILGKTLTVTIDVIYYSGEKEVITYRVDVDSGKLI